MYLPIGVSGATTGGVASENGGRSGLSRSLPPETAEVAEVDVCLTSG